jgi:Ca2+-binding RTX toxin-like protein
VATLKNGGHVVTYTVTEASSDDIYAQIVNPNGSLGTLIPVSTTAFDAERSRVEVLPNGNFVVVYEQEFNPTTNPGDTDVLYKIYSPTGGLVTSAFVTGAANLDVGEGFPDVAALKGGRFVVVWEDGAGDADGTGIRMSLYNNDGIPVAGRTDKLVNTAQAGEQIDADVTALADGGFLVTWRDSGFAAHGQRFDASGNPVGGEFTIDGAGVDSHPPRATVLADGRIAVAVQNGFVDGDILTGIFDPRTSPIKGTSGNDTLVAGRKGSTVNGLSGNDKLFGFEGKDKLNGGKGKDLLTGGAGRDIFDFNSIKDSVKGSKHDKIEDFKRSQNDRIDLRDIDADPSKNPGNDKFKFIGKDAFSGVDGELRCKNGVVQGDINGDKRADFEIKVNVQTLHKDDFYL